MGAPRSPTHSTNSSNLADLLERVLDKGVVIAGDIKVKLVDIELLSIQVRLVICSVDKAKEMGMDWWVNHPLFTNAKTDAPPAPDKQVAELQERLARLEAELASRTLPAAQPQQPPAPTPLARPVVPPWAS